MVGVGAAAVTANVGNAAFVVVGGGNASIAVEAGVGLAGGHQGGEVGVGGRWWRWHAVVGVCGVVDFGRVNRGGRVWWAVGDIVVVLEGGGG